MKRKPTNLEIAAEIGITEADVERYRGDTFLLGDGAWLIHFLFQMPRELRGGLTGSFTYILKPKSPGAERRSEAL